MFYWKKMQENVILEWPIYITQQTLVVLEEGYEKSTQSNRVSVGNVEWANIFMSRCAFLKGWVLKLN